MAHPDATMNDIALPEEMVGKPTNILVVDDDLGSLMMAEEALDEAGFNVLQAENGLEATEVGEASAPDMIIMDVIMPKMNGFDACQHIRNTDWGRHVPILMVTGLEDIDSIHRAYEVGATDFLTKPINFFVLPHRVKYMLRSADTADRLRESQRLLDHAQRIAQLGHWEWNLSNKATLWSRSCSTLIPVPERSRRGAIEVLKPLINPEDRAEVVHQFDTALKEAKPFKGEFRTIELEGQEKVIRLQAEPQCNPQGECVSILGTVQDITERHNIQRQIHNLAYYDHVTGLPNRTMLHDRLNQALNRGKRYKQMFAVLFLDLDRFKMVNDTLGHDAGDELLSQVSARLEASIRKSDELLGPINEKDSAEEHTIARLGGDEFVVLLSQIDEAADAARAAKRIADRIAEPYTIKGSAVNISTTIGISVYPNDAMDSDTLLKNADIAMYHAKKRGRNLYQFFSEEIQEKAQERFSLEQNLRLAIKNHDFHLVYQPKIDAQTGLVKGVEALVRWDDPKHGTILPSEFISLAEETELIIPLGEWIIGEACRQAKLWHDMGFEHMHVAVNCSSIQLTKADIPGLIVSVLEETKLTPECLEIELTESLLLDDAERGIAILESLQATGISTSIDDFGTGFSSMSYLRRLPVSKLKIDRSFVNEIGNNKSDEAIVSAMLTLASHLNLEVVAEGVETDGQMNFLVEHGCDELQGYHISKPLEADDFVEWANNWNTQKKQRRDVA